MSQIPVGSRKRPRSFVDDGSRGDYKRMVDVSRVPPPAMLYGSRRSSRRRTSTRTRRRRRTGRLVRPYRSVANIPQAITRRLTTTFRANIDPAAASAITASIFALNGAYDPTLALGGVQPLFFDQYNAMYQQYVVLGWDVLIECVSGDNTNPVIVGFTPMTTSTALTTPEHYIESKGTTHKVMTQDIDKIVIRNRGSIKKWLRPNGGSLINDATYCGSPSTNPTTVLFGHLWVAALSYTGTDPSAAQFVIRLSQVIRFFNPVTPARS